MRQVAREPKQLELEGERERVERRACIRDLVGLVEEVEEAGERLERPLVRLRLAEQAQHRLGPDQPHAEPVRLLARRPVGGDQVDARDGLQLARALVQLEPHVRERLEAGPDAGLRLPDPLRDRADPASLPRVEVEDPIGLAEAQRAQDDRLRLVAAAHWPFQSRAAAGEYLGLLMRSKS